MASRKEQKEQAKAERLAKEQELAKKHAKHRRNTIVATILGLAVLAVIAVVIINTNANKKPNGIVGAADVQARFSGVKQNGLWLGESNAPVTIIEYADLKCPFCAEFTKNVFPTIVDNYIRTGKVKIKLQLLTFLDAQTPGVADSSNAATYATATGLQNKIWNFTDLFYLNQKSEQDTYVTDKYLTELSKNIPGLDSAKAFEDRNGVKVADQMDAAQAGFAKSGAQGTPTFVIGKTGGQLSVYNLTSTTDSSEFEAKLESLLK